MASDLIPPLPESGPLGWLRWVDERPEHPALLAVQDQQTIAATRWADLARQVAACAEGLWLSGFRPGDRWVHTLGNSPAGVVAMLASFSVGVVEVPLDPALSSVEQQRLTERVGGRRIPGYESLASGSFALSAHATALPSVSAVVDRLRNGPAQSEVDRSAAPALVLFTSGSLGTPKPVTLSLGNLSSNAAAKLAAVPQTVADVRLVLLPIWHAYARTCDLGTWLLSGCSLGIGLGWESWQRLAPLLRPTLINTVPSLAMRLLGEPHDTPSWNRLRLIGCGGAALSTEAFERFRRRGVVVIQGYGLTEASPVICSATPENSRAGHVGRPVDGWETRIDPEGHLSVRGPGVMLGYWNQQSHRAETPTSGWLETGDLVEVDVTDGQFRIIGRADDRITLSNGKKVDPGPIERRVLSIAGIRHAVLVGRDRHVVLWIDFDNRQTCVDEISKRIATCLADLPSWQRPRAIHPMPQAFANTPETLTAKGTIIRERVLALINEANRHRPVASDRSDCESVH